jgi:Tat protein translocase TatB subunit
MFGIGLPELIIILIVALIVLGPAKLPEVARSVGKALGEFKRVADDVKDSFEEEMGEETGTGPDDHKKTAGEDGDAPRAPTGEDPEEQAHAEHATGGNEYGDTGKAESDQVNDHKPA